MNRGQVALLVVLAMTMAPLLLSREVSATTQGQASLAGAGFHEPNFSWYDKSYKYRIPINVTSHFPMDTNITTASVNFGDYFSNNAGIIDLASMQLVHGLESGSSEAINYEMKTDALDIWNPPTLKDLQEVILGSLISNNATLIGRVFDYYHNTGNMSQSIRFQAFLNEPRDNVKFQFVYDPENVLNLLPTDYLSVYAGIPGSGNAQAVWGSPIRIYPSLLPTTRAWTQYFTLPLGQEMSGMVWIVMEASPSILAKTERSYFAIDFSFLDGSGFGRSTTHFLPDLDINSKSVTQNNYYPRVQVLEQETMPRCTLWFNNAKETPDLSRYFLYFNFINESNGKLVNNYAVPLTGDLNIPQVALSFKLNGTSFYIPKAGTGNVGGITISNPSLSEELVNQLMQIVGFQASDPSFSVKNEFGTMYSQVTITTSIAVMTLTLYYGCNFIEIKIHATDALDIKNTIKWTTTDRPLTLLGDDASLNDISTATPPLSGDSNSIELVNPANKTFVTVLFNKTIGYTVSTIDTTNQWYELHFYPGANVLATIQLPRVKTIYTTDSGVAILASATTLQQVFNNRLLHVPTIDIGDVDVYAPLELFVLNAKTGLFTYQTVGDQIQVALFGNNLQSISVTINGFTSETGTNGVYTIPAFSHGLLDASYNFIFKGRNTFGDVVEKNLTITVADNSLDVLRVVLLSTFFLPLVGIGVTVLSTVVVVKNKRIEHRPGKDD